MTLTMGFRGLRARAPRAQRARRRELYGGDGRHVVGDDAANLGAKLVSEAGVDRDAARRAVKRNLFRSRIFVERSSALERNKATRAIELAPGVACSRRPNPPLGSIDSMRPEPIALFVLNGLWPPVAELGERCSAQTRPRERSRPELTVIEPHLPR